MERNGSNDRLWDKRTAPKEAAGCQDGQADLLFGGGDIYVGTGLPETETLLLGEVHLVTGFHVECVIPGIDVGEGTIDTPLTQSVRITLHTVADLLLRDVLSPYACIGDEETLLGSEAVERLQLLGLLHILQGIEGNLQTSVVGEVLTEGEAAVRM